MTGINLGSVYLFKPNGWPDDEDHGRPSESWVVPLAKVQDFSFCEDTTYMVRELGKRGVFVVYENELSAR